MEDIFEKVKEIVQKMIPHLSLEKIESAFQQISRGEGLKEKGFSDEMIELLQNISNEEKIDELMYKIIPSISGFQELEELQKAKLEMSNFSTICSKKYGGDRMECSTHYRELQEKIKMLDINAKKSERDRKCRGWFGGFKNNDECKELLLDIKELEMKLIRENYGRLLNNYYMTLAQYLVQCRDFETSDDGLIPSDYDKQKQELKLKMEEFQTNNCRESVEPHIAEKCSGIISEKERLENALGINGLRKLWEDFVGEHTPKDLEGNPIKREELEEIYENIQYFAPLVLSGERLPEETEEYKKMRKELIGRKSGKCFKSDRLSILTMVIESRYVLNNFIKDLGSFGNLLYLSFESGLFQFVEEELGMGQGGGGKKRKSIKRKTRKKKKSKIKSKKYKKSAGQRAGRQGGGAAFRARRRRRRMEGERLELSTKQKLAVIIVLCVIPVICIILGGACVAPSIFLIYAAAAATNPQLD